LFLKNAHGNLARKLFAEATGTVCINAKNAKNEKKKKKAKQKKTSWLLYGDFLNFWDFPTLKKIR
jgi:hypothetical protein